MPASKMIAALLGPTLIVSSASLLFNLGSWPALIEGVSPALIMVAGYAAFIPGLAIIYFHNRWSGGWEVFITVMGWLLAIVGTLRILFPIQLTALASVVDRSAAGVVFPIVAFVLLTVGGFLTFMAYSKDGRGSDGL